MQSILWKVIQLSDEEEFPQVIVRTIIRFLFDDIKTRILNILNYG